MILYVFESQYFPTVNYVFDLVKYQYVNLIDCDSYIKAGFFNRCVVAGSSSVINLSVPLEKGRNQKADVKDVKIAYQANWQLQHLRTLESCYRKSPYFEYYAGDIERLLNMKKVYLLDLNMEILYWLKKVLKLKVDIKQMSHIPPGEMEDLRNRWNPKNYQNAAPMVTYPQVFEERIGFLPNLSVLDAVFCYGPELAQKLTPG